MILLIDDAKDGHGYDIVARNADAGKLLLFALNGNIEELYIDFDLGDISGRRENTGLGVIELALENDCLPDKVTIVSLNPVGRKTIRDLLLSNSYVQRTDSRFERVR